MRFPAWILGSAFVLFAPVSASAQAYLGEPNSLSADVSYTFAPSGQIVSTTTGDDDAFNDSQPNAVVFAHIVELAAQYVTPVEGLAVDIRIPMVGVELRDGSFEHFPRPGPYDDGAFHLTPTDIRGGLRYQVKAIERYVGLSFGVAGSIPVRDYPTSGFAVPAAGLKSLHFNTAIARTLDPLLPNAFFQLEYEFTWREHVDVDPETEKFNRDFSDINFTLGHFLPKGFQLSAAATARVSHGGASFSQLVFEPVVVQDNHDRLLDEQFLLLGGNLGYAASEAVSLFAAVRFFVWGENTRNQNLFALGASYQFF